MYSLSLKLLRYNFFINAFITFVIKPANITRYGLTANEVTQLTDFLTAWNSRFASYVDPITHGSITIDAINTVYWVGFPLTQSIRHKIKGNLTLTLSSEEKAICQLKTGDTVKSNAPLPKNAPSLACIFTTSMMMRFVALNPDLPFKKAKPPYAHAIGVKMAIVGVGGVPLPSDYVRLDDETETIFEVLFTAGQVGKVAYIVAFYINSRGEAGNDSMPYIITIV